MTKDTDMLRPSLEDHRQDMAAAYAANGGLRYYRKDGPVFDSYGEACSETGETPTVTGYQSFKKWHEYAKTRQPPSDCSCFAPRPNLGPAGPLNEFAKMARGAKMARRVP